VTDSGQRNHEEPATRRRSKGYLIELGAVLAGLGMAQCSASDDTPAENGAGSGGQAASSGTGATGGSAGSSGTSGTSGAAGTSGSAGSGGSLGSGGGSGGQSSPVGPVGSASSCLRRELQARVSFEGFFDADDRQADGPGMRRHVTR